MRTSEVRTIIPSENDQKLAAESRLALEPLVETTHSLHVQLLDSDTPNRAMSIPAPAVRMLSRILEEMAKGNAMTLIPANAMLSTQEAADLLNVSRPFLVQLLEAGRIPYQRLGSHRRVRIDDLMSFKASSDANREDALRQLTEQAQELKLGY
jgi:excisionase family DNA binding protein